ncbi:MAG: HlyD family efflux transporter periplasmic adaptor subunit [Lachnospiraceae bacterium]|nr:HlyD family efflux transporter periplasmic adaptor subunit [Lachnospiraceae bacterium]
MESKEQQEFEKRKGWIKNAIIIFLVVMLILTLFSNTIMNYSLPQVVVQNVSSGSITTKVRGSGTVESGDPYNVTVKQSRTVSGINVKVGSVVEAGDVLLYLAEGDSAELDAAKKALAEAQRAYDIALLSGEITDSAIAGSTGNLDVSALRTQVSGAQQAVKNAQNEVDAAQAVVNDLTNAVAVASAATLDVTAENNAITEAQYYYDNYNNGLATMSAEMTDLKSKLEYYSSLEASEENDAKIAELNKKIADLEPKLIEQTTLVANAQTALNQARANLQHRQDTAGTDQNVKNLQAQLAAANATLTAKQGILEDKKQALTTLTTNIANKINLNSLYRAIQDAQAKVEAEELKAIGSEVTAPIAGKILQINVQSGKDTDPATPVVLMQPEGQGYTLSFSVDNEQAKLVAPGDPAEIVNGWWYSDVTVTVSGIRPDPQSPTQKKQITFDLDGEGLTAGQSMTLSVGSRTAEYEFIVPNSALHDSNEGKYILVVEAKSTPLGNRYFAVRKDVNVVAADEKQSAVTGALEYWSYVITTATKPIEAGEQVRLSDENS